MYYLLSAGVTHCVIGGMVLLLLFGVLAAIIFGNLYSVLIAPFGVLPIVPGIVGIALASHPRK